MDQLKLILSIGAALSCGALGILFSMRLSRRARRLSVWRGALTKLQGAMKYAGFSLPNALSYAAHPDAPALLLLKNAMEREPSASLPALWATIAPEDGLFLEDWAALTACIASLEGATAQEQCEGIELCLLNLERLEELARKKTETNARLYMTGGCLVGAALLIILL